jgi:hypothetical protein
VGSGGDDCAIPELRLSFNKAAEHLTRELAGEVATFERIIEKATAIFYDQ